MLAICQLKRANSQFSIQLYHLSLFLCQGRGPSGRMYIPYPIQLLYLHITLLSDNLLTHSYADEFSVYCSNVDQIAEALTAHSSNIKEWADEAISAPNPPSLYSPLNSHNPTPILKSLWTTPYFSWKGLPVCIPTGMIWLFYVYYMYTNITNCYNYVYIV